MWNLGGHKQADTEGDISVFSHRLDVLKYSCIFDIEGVRHLLAVFREKQAEEEEGCVSTLVTVLTFVYLIFCNIKVHRLFF